MSSTTNDRSGKWGRGLIWFLVAVEFLGMGAAGYSKFGNPEGWMSMFEGWGYPPAFALVIGGLEMLGASLLWVPSLAAYSALGLIVIMVGAVGTVLIHPGQMGPGVAVFHLFALSVIAWARWSLRRGAARGRAR